MWAKHRGTPAPLHPGLGITPLNDLRLPLRHFRHITRTNMPWRAACKPWLDEKSLQGAVNAYLSVLKTEGLNRKGCTLHGLRLTYAADQAPWA